MGTLRAGALTRLELNCLYCGHALGEVDAPAGRRPTMAELRAAYARTANATPPAWDAHGNPRCPRCAALLFIEPTGRRIRVYEQPREERADRQERDEREDAYAREDVYAAAAEVPA